MMTATQAVYAIIRQHGPISRSAIHRKFNMRLATITRITGELLGKKLIRSCGKDAAALGRSPELLQINESAFHVLGLHAVRKAIRGGIVSSGGKLESYSNFALPENADAKCFLAALGKFAGEMLKTAKKSGIEVTGVGLALPGEVNPQTGCLTQAAVILPGLVEVPCGTYLSGKLKLPIAVDHDTAMITLAEMLWGKGKACQNFGALFVGHGIGGKFVIDGKLHCGSRNRSGELGHIPLRRDGAACDCGLRGCFEALASIPAIERSYAADTSFATIVERAAQGEEKAIAVLSTAAGYIGEAIAIIFDMLDIESLVINGDIIAAEKTIRQAIIDTAVAHSHSKHPPNKEFIAFSSFGPEVGVLGAAAVSVTEILAKQGVTG